MKLLVFLFALLIGLSTGMELQVSGHVSGNGTNETVIDIGDGNWTGNGTVWVLEWRSDLYGRQNLPNVPLE
jgi:hypothetical protein